MLGTLHVGRVGKGRVFQAKDLNTLRTYTDLFAIALANANSMIARTREQQALHEIEIAAELQEALVPTAYPEAVNGQELFLKRVSARAVSGDYAEGIQLPDGRLLLVIVDVMGKGVSAAFLAGMLRVAIRMMVTGNAIELSALVIPLNKILCQLVGDLTLFATAGFALIDADLGAIEISNAGHCPIFLGRSAGRFATIEPSGPPLGLFPDQKYRVERYPLEQGDWLLMVTDGLFEWEMDGKEIWGWKRFLQAVDCSPMKTGESLWEDLQAYRSDFSSDQQLEDDQTLVFWRRT
jgi:serine phosphatase RsbU (regulator of sigma subunit)